MYEATCSVGRLMKLLRARMEPDELGEPVEQKATKGVLYRLALRSKMTAQHARAAEGASTYWHGTKWPATWSICRTRVLFESSDKGKGHDFGDHPGAYVAKGNSAMDALYYTRFTTPCADGVFWAPVVEVLANPHKCRPLSKSKKGGGQRLFAEVDTVVSALWVVGRTAKQMDSSCSCHLPLGWMPNIEINPEL
jgi:hypothetical protein